MKLCSICNHLTGDTFYTIQKETRVAISGKLIIGDIKGFICEDCIKPILKQPKA